MWLADKPEFQQELAVRLAKLTTCLRRDEGLRFMRVFWETMRREWHGIDHYRCAGRTHPRPVHGARTWV